MVFLTLPEVLPSMTKFDFRNLRNGRNGYHVIEGRFSTKVEKARHAPTLNPFALQYTNKRRVLNTVSVKLRVNVSSLMSDD